MRRWIIGCATLLVVLACMVPAGAVRQTPQTPVGMTRTVVLENARVRVVRVRIEPGAREALHKHEYDIIVTQLTPGQAESVVGDEKSSAWREAGYTFFVPKGTMHLGANVGKEPFDVMTTILK
jgi:quercetin dioxygenase-like cupin family protein